MNLLLVHPHELNDQQQLTITGRRHEHLRKISKVKVGEQLAAGVLNSKLGLATVLSQQANSTLVQLSELHSLPPPSLPLTLILALPRPLMLARSLEHLTALGVKKLILLQTAKVEKSYWQSSQLQPEKIKHHLTLGLEQAKDTLMPEVSCYTRFKPFVEDVLPSLAADTLKLVAHPGAYPDCPRNLSKPATLVIGPEGGLVDFEVRLLQEQGFQPVQLGPRILRVETAVTALVARLF